MQGAAEIDGPLVCGDAPHESGIAAGEFGLECDGRRDAVVVQDDDLAGRSDGLMGGLLALALLAGGGGCTDFGLCEGVADRHLSVRADRCRERAVVGGGVEVIEHAEHLTTQRWVELEAQQCFQLLQ